MNQNLIEKFEKLGARARIRPLAVGRRQWLTSSFIIDIGHDKRGEFFDIRAAETSDVQVLDVQPRDRHLLLMVRRPSEGRRLEDNKDKFLCGHDERHWFVAAVPNNAPVSTVITAKEALKPVLIRNLESGRKGKRQKRHGRRTESFVRQGEWFFVPEINVSIDPRLVLHHEPIRRTTRGKPHMCEYLYRENGTTVYLYGDLYPKGLSEFELRHVLKLNPEARHWKWTTMNRDPKVYVKGKVSHSDHATIHLNGWHRVIMNTEHLSRAMSSVAFLD